MQCGLCPSRNQVAMVAVFLVSDFDRCFRNISVVIATSCRFLCGNITKVKTPSVWTCNQVNPFRVDVDNLMRQTILLL